MAIRYQEIADRLRAFRLGSGLSAEEIARRVGISRTALYRFEKGELAKIETLEKLSELLGVSMPTLLGVGIEYMPSAVSYFERVRQLEESAEHIMVLSGPISFLLASDNYLTMASVVLKESLPPDLPDREQYIVQVEKVMSVLARRKENYRRRRPGILNLISARSLHRFIQNGMVGNSLLPKAEIERRKAIARAEVEHFISVIEEDAIGVQIGVVTESLPHINFQIFRMADHKMLTLSPFNLGEQPNIRLGVAMVTSAHDAITLHERTVQEMWRNAIKGPAAVECLRALLAASPGGGDVSPDTRVEPVDIKESVNALAGPTASTDAGESGEEAPRELKSGAARANKAKSVRRRRVVSD